MKKWILLLIVLFFLSGNVWAGAYPEYVGNYIECSKGWCEVKHYWLHKMTLADPGRGSYAHTTYPGFFSLPNDLIQVNTKNLRILLFSGRSNADPRTAALVKLKQLPYNNRKIDAIDDTEYKRKITYSAKYVNKLLWIIDQEKRLRFKPIKDEAGMFVFEPNEPLDDGLYAIDSRMPGDKTLKLSPLQEGLFTHKLEENVILFVVGDKQKLEKNLKTIQESRNQGNIEQSKSISDNQSSDKKSFDKNIEKSINNFIDGIFGKGDVKK